MEYKALRVCLLLCSLASPGVYAQPYQGLSAFSTPETGVNIFNEPGLRADIKVLLKENYHQYMGNFEAFADPIVLDDGGLLIDAWLRHLRLQNASALVIRPDGRLYTAWVVPDNAKIMYFTNDHNMKGIQPDIAEWAKRFEDISFQDRERPKPFVDVVPDTRYFNSSNFLVRVRLVCSDRYNICNQATYVGKSKNDGSTVALMGESIRKDCGETACPIESYRFENKNTHKTYVIDVKDSSLTISTNGNVLVHEKGRLSDKSE
ncbi:hypothetical protein PMPD1_0263 [Paramixta manurensis]|uniref:DUF306 domain-containing protein n=1 Tax=Paramixta manurensis TaxID=2740817 RepID=A0A6M8U3V3_9GAMM|nr:hypothetical protein PMPD1_0263 [Erwiniaceae bacterium PD-1]